MDEKKSTSALKVNKGIEQPEKINQQAIHSLKAKRKELLSAEDYFQGIRSGNRVILSRAITLVESSLSSHYELAQQVVEKCIPYSGKSIRIGITGVPGVGKSTFIESLGKSLTAKGHRLAVLAVDPSSEISKGSILGDKTRMEHLAVDENAFVRPSPSAGSLGGVARKTREIILLCEAAGFDVVFVETVGVGQSEVTVHSMVDFFLLLMLAGAGDELQGIKRGIIEMCDGMAINKADGDNINKAKAAKVQYENALHLFPPHPTGWTPRVMTCSSIQKEGMADIWQMIQNHDQMMKEGGHFQNKRIEQQKYQMIEAIHEALKRNFYNNTEVTKQLKEMEGRLSAQTITSHQAAQRLLEIYFHSTDHNSSKSTK